MKRLILLCLFLSALVWAVSQYSGSLAHQGNYDSLILDFRETDNPTEVDARIEALAQQFNLDLSLNSEFSEADHVYIVEGDETVLETLRQSEFAADTEFIEPNYVYGISNNRSFLPNDPNFNQQWNLKSINVEGAWLLNRGQGVTVAVIDTGITQVPDLAKTQFVPGYNFVQDRVDATDDNGHGTHVAGTIAQSTNNSYGVAGVAYEAKLMPLKVLAAGGSGTVSDIAEAVRFAADNGADVINMSLGGGGASKLFQEAIDYAHAKGVAIIAAAGNEGRNAVSYPARYRHVLGVAAFDSQGNKAPYSNYGAGVDIAAPGGATHESKQGGILQETIDRRNGKSKFEYFQGTSMATPHVAGVAAMLKSVGIKSPDQVFEILQKSAQAIEDDSRNYFGAGRLDAAAALTQAGNPLPWWPLPIFGDGFFRGWLWLDLESLYPLRELIYVLVTLALTTVLWLRSPFPIRGPMTVGLVLGSNGLFMLQVLYVVDLPQWPLRLAGSSIPELGSAATTSGQLNPIFASALVPLLLIALFLSESSLRWLAIGTAVGVAAVLGVNAAIDPNLLWLGDGVVARVYLAANAAFCLLLAGLALRSVLDTIRKSQV